MKVNRSQIVGTMFPFMRSFPETASILSNFIQHHWTNLKNSTGSKHSWYEWMQQQGGANALDIKWLDFQGNYVPTDQPVSADMKGLWRGPLTRARAMSRLPIFPGLNGIKPHKDETRSVVNSCGGSVSPHVRHVAPQTMHNTTGRRERFNRTFKKQYHLGATRVLDAGLDPYMSQKDCFRTVACFEPAK